MASVERIVKVILEGDNRLSPTMISGAKSVDLLRNAVTGAARPLSRLADGILMVDKALAALSAGLIAYSSYRAMEFQTATTSLEKILGDQEHRISEVTEGVLKLSNAYGVSSSALQDVATDFKRAGFEIDSLNELTTQAITLYTAAAEAEFEMGDATTSLIRIMKGYRVGVGEAARITDVLNKVSNENATSVSMLAEAMARTAPVAQQAGFSIEELASVLTPTIEVFQSGEQAGTAWRTALVKLKDDAAPVQEALEKLGVSQKDANGVLRSGKEILFDVARAFENVEQSEKDRLAAQLVGIRQASKFLTTLRDEEYRLKVLADAMGATGSAQQELTKRMQDSRKQLDRVIAGFNNFFVVLGQGFLEGNTALYKNVADFENTLQSMVEAGTFDPVLDRIDNFFKQVGVFFQDVAQALPDAFELIDFTSLSDTLERITGEISELFDGLDLSKPEDLAVALQYLVDTLDALINVTSGIVKGMEPLFTAFKEGVKEAKNLDSGLQESFGRLLGNAKLITKAGLEVTAALSVINESGVKFQDIVAAISGSVKVVVNVIQIVQDTVIQFVGRIAEIFTEILGFMAKIVDYVPGIGGFAEEIQGINKSLEGFLAAVDKQQQQNFGELVDGWKIAASGFAGEAGRAADAVRDIPDDKKVKIESNAGKTGEEWLKLIEKIKETPEEKKIKVEADTADVDKLKSIIDSVPAEKDVSFRALADKESFFRFGDFLVDQTDGYKKFTDISLEVKPDEQSLTDTERAVENLATKLTADQKLQLKIDIEKLQNDTELAKKQVEEDSEIMQKRMELAFELDMKRLDNDLELAKEKFNLLGDTIEGVNENITGLFGLLSGDVDFQTFYAIQRQIARENDLRERAFELQQEQWELQKKIDEAKIEFFERKGSLFTIDATGLTSSLEMVIEDLVEHAQIHMIEEGIEFIGL